MSKLNNSEFLLHKIEELTKRVEELEKPQQWDGPWVYKDGAKVPAATQIDESVISNELTPIEMLLGKTSVDALKRSYKDTDTTPEEVSPKEYTIADVLVEVGLPSVDDDIQLIISNAQGMIMVDVCSEELISSWKEPTHIVVQRTLVAEIPQWMRGE